MISYHVEERFAKTLLPNVELNSSVIPGQCHISQSWYREPLSVESWMKKRMITWLQVKGIKFPRKVFKSDISAIIERQKLAAQLIVDDIAAAKGK